MLPSLPAAVKVDIPLSNAALAAFATIVVLPFISLYEYEKDFIEFINANIKLFRDFGRGIFNITARETFTNYRISIEKLEEALKSNDAHKIAAMQEEVCTAAKGLKVHPAA